MQFIGEVKVDQQQMQDMDLSKATEIKCEVCLNSTFKQTMMLKRLSAIISPNGQETIIPVMVFACEKCDHVNLEFIKS